MGFLKTFIEAHVALFHLKYWLKCANELLEFLEERICVDSSSEEMEWIKTHNELLLVYNDFEHTLSNYRNRLSQMRAAVDDRNISRIQILRTSWEFERAQLEKMTDNFMKKFFDIAAHENILLAKQIDEIYMVGVNELDERKLRNEQSAEKL